MSVIELEKAVSGLSPQELQEFRSWFADFDMAKWDQQIEEDSASGHLDHLIDKALGEHRAGRTSEL